MYELTLVLHGDTQMDVEQFWDDRMAAHRAACKAARNVGGVLGQEVFGHPGSYLFTDGQEIVGYYTLREI